MPAKKTLLAALVLPLAVVAYVMQRESTSMNSKRARRCGDSEYDNFDILSRIVGGKSAIRGQHPWMVSLKRGGKHFCGGTIVSATHVLTAAHCVTDKYVLAYVKVYVGEYDVTVREQTETFFSVISITMHPDFDSAQPINYDLAVLELDGNIQFDNNISPVCLPHIDDVFEPGSLCVALGWGRLKEKGILPKSLQEVVLPIIKPRKCTDVMATLKGNMVFDTILCAGFPEGGKDACQGDSGGPLLCQRSHGNWVLVGVTSWGMGCARKWLNNIFQLPENRGSPGIFTDIQKLIHWVNIHLDTEKTRTANSQAPCSVEDGLVSGTSGKIILPRKHSKYYANNEMCVWNIIVPDGMHILLDFTYFDIEYDTTCDLDYLSIYSTEGQLIGKYCGDVPPGPIVITSTNIMLKFTSDFQEYRTGFAVSYTAIHPDIYQDSGCGSLSVHSEEGEIQTMNYPEHYSNGANCHWIIHAPNHLYVKLTFHDFQVEPSENCLIDSVVVYQDLAGVEMIGQFCGFSLPPPLLSSGNMMQIKFISDTSDNYRGFRATFSFIKASEIIQIQKQNKMSYRPNINEKHTESTCGASPTPPKFVSRSLDVGEEAIPYSWPWHVSLQFATEHMCDGTIISEYWVLTSAYCVFERSQVYDLWRVVAGIHDLTKPDHNQIFSVKKIFVHPGFNYISLDYNLALLQMAEPFRFNDYVKPICLPKSWLAVMPSSLCVYTGWGIDVGKEKSSKLQQLEVPVLIKDACKAHYQTHPGGITERMFCAGFPEGQDNNYCKVKAGGPLVCLSDDLKIYSINGVASFGVNCMDNSKPGVYTNVTMLLDWINHILNVPVIEDAILHGKSISENEKTLKNASDEEHSNQDKQYSLEHETQLPGRVITEIKKTPIMVNDNEGTRQESNFTSQQGNTDPNVTSSAHNVYFASGCEDVVLMQSPGEIKVDSKDKIYPNGFRCQWRIIAPKNNVIRLELKHLRIMEDNKKCCNHLAIYEGVSSDKVFREQLKNDNVPSIIWSLGSALTVDVATTSADPEFGLWLLYSFHHRK